MKRYFIVKDMCLDQYIQDGYPMTEDSNIKITYTYEFGECLEFDSENDIIRFMEEYEYEGSYKIEKIYTK